jgi:hypothetical protein
MSERLHQFYSSEEFGELVKTKPSSIRHSLCVRGHYMNVVPRRGPNGRLWWPKDDVDRVLSGEEAQP